MPEPVLSDDEEEEDDETSQETVSDESETDTEEAGAEEDSGEESEASADDEEEEVDVEEADLPDDDDDDDDSNSPGLLDGTTFGISNKILLGIGISALVLVLILRNWDPNTTDKDYDRETVEGEVDEGSEGQVQADAQATGLESSSQYDPDTEEAAINEVF